MEDQNGDPPSKRLRASKSDLEVITCDVSIDITADNGYVFTSLSVIVKRLECRPLSMAEMCSHGRVQRSPL